MRSHTKCTQTTHAQGCALTRVWRHTHTRPGLRPHPGVDTHRCRAVPLPRCGHTHTHTHTRPGLCPHPGVDTHTHMRAGLCPHPGVDTHARARRAMPSPGCGHTRARVQGYALTRVWTHTRARTGLCPHPGVDTHTLELSCCCLHCHRYPRQKHSFLLHNRAPFILHPSYAPFYSSTYKDTSFPDAFWIGLMVKLRRHHGTHALDSAHSRHGTCPHPYRDRS